MCKRERERGNVWELMCSIRPINLCPLTHSEWFAVGEKSVDNADLDGSERGTRAKIVLHPPKIISRLIIQTATCCEIGEICVCARDTGERAERLL